jgi:hypothetical protein
LWENYCHGNGLVTLEKSNLNFYKSIYPSSSHGNSSTGTCRQHQSPDKFLSKVHQFVHVDSVTLGSIITAWPNRAMTGTRLEIVLHDNAYSDMQVRIQDRQIPLIFNTRIVVLGGVLGGAGKVL